MRPSRYLNSARLVVIGFVTVLTFALPDSPTGFAPGSTVSNAEVRDRIKTELVIFTAQVMDGSGRPVTNLRHTDFKVFDKDRPQPIAFWSREDQPSSVAIVFDTSMSATKRRSALFAAIRHEILSLKERSNELNEYSIVSADLSPQLVTDWTTDGDYLMEGLSRTAVALPKARTGVFDACALALNILRERPTSKNAVLLISDGQDTASNLSYSGLYDSMLRSNGLVYLICPSNVNTPLASNGSKPLTKLALDSGAIAFFPSSIAQVKAALATIADAIRDRYVIGYYPPDPKRDGSWHPVRITASLPTEKSPDTPELVVRTRLGYYAPTETR
jgi:Ca-activated chloride channel homolog